MARKQMCSWSLQNSFLYGAAYSSIPKTAPFPAGPS